MKIKRGSTSVRRLIFIADSSSTTGAGLANLVYNSSGLVAYYFAGDLSNEVQITLATATLGTWASGGFVAVDNTNMPGWYEIGIPDAALDGGNEVAIQFRGATNMVPVNIHIELDTVDYQTDAFGALKPTVAGRTLDVTAGGEAGIDWANVGSPTTSVTLSGTTIATSQVVASVTGAVGSVTGAVGSVTGNVGGNVVGSVGSVTNMVTANVVEMYSDAFAAEQLKQMWYPVITYIYSGIGGDIDGSVALLSNVAMQNIADYVLDEAMAGHTTAGTFGKAVADILDDTGTSGVVVASGSKTGYSLSASGLSAINAWTVNITGNLSGSVGSVTGAVGSVTGNVGGNVTGSVGSVATDGITSGSLSASAIAEIADGVWDEALAGHLGAGSTGEALNAAGSAGDPWTTTLPGSYTGSQAGKILADILVDTGTTLQAELDGIQADTEDIQTRLPAALVGGRMDASVGAMAANTLTASALAADAVTEIQSGLVTAASLPANFSSLQISVGGVVEADMVQLMNGNVNYLAGVGLDPNTLVVQVEDFSATAKSEINAEVVDVLSVDTHAELAAPPAATSSLKDKLTWMFMWFRNKSTQTATQRKLYADDTTTVVSTEATSDDGTTYTKNEAV